MRTLKARYHEGKIEPLEPLDVPEGSEITLTVTPTEATVPETDPTSATAGAWGDLLDCEALEKDVYRDRQLKTRPPVRL